ncbi:MAG TPA: endonuclease/exonuclease/phosphatase family protein [Ignavibacteriales bacterium]|nr:endonuclease/exonuclease/phosphatase family protein [Ignavibacteriales bacterium]
MKNVITLLALLILSFSSLSAQEIQSLRVVTYNIHHGQGTDKRIDIKRIGDFLDSCKVGLAALQEVDRGVERTGKIDILKLLSDQTGMHMAFGKNIDFQGGDYGNAILSRFDIDTVKNLHYKMMLEGEQRGLLQTVIEANGEKIVFMATHTGDKNTEAEKLMNADEIINALKSYNGLPVILCGDFNDRPESKMHAKLKEYFSDLWEILGKGPGYSFPSVNPDRRIDYIYISKEGLKKLKPVFIKVLHSEASDHLPLMAEFELLKNK